MLLCPLAETRRLSIDLDLQPAPCHGDSTRITRVITNLFTNAIHFTPADGTITLLTHQDSSAHSFISATGLGLAICKAIVETHGGNITVESAKSQ